MNQLSFSSSKATPPPQRSGDIPILSALKECYLLWHSFFRTVPKPARYTVGKKIDDIFIEIILIAFKASFQKEEVKLASLYTVSDQFDRLKYLLTLLWEMKALDNKKFSMISERCAAIGKMLGGWIKETKLK